MDRARDDVRVLAVARTGSLAGGTADRWSDVDPFLGVDPTSTVAEVLADLSAWLSADVGAVHDFDLLGGEPFDVVFDDVARQDGQEDGAAPSDGTASLARRTDQLVGLGWHHALHARTAISRGQPLRAEHAKGADRLPEDLRQGLAAALVTNLDVDDLERAREAAVRIFVVEVEHVDARVAASLRRAVTGESA